MSHAAFAIVLGLLLFQPKPDAPTPEHAKPDTKQLEANPPQSTVTIDLKDGYRYITANGLPNHDTGTFPGRGNPNSIHAQSYRFRVPEHPKPAEKPTELSRQPFGVALNGVVFDPGTAEFWKDDPSSGWRLEAIAPAGVKSRDLGIDKNHAHVQPNGAYHYHAGPTGLVDKLLAEKSQKHGEQMLLLGWAADGYPIYDMHAYSKADDAKSEITHLRSSYRVKKGDRPGPDATPPGPGGEYDGKYTQDWEYIAGSGDLDECNGRTGVTPDFPEGTYYYVITDTFPFIPRLCRATPDPSFERHGPPPGGRPGGVGGRRGTRPPG